MTSKTIGWNATSPNNLTTTNNSSSVQVISSGDIPVTISPREQYYGRYSEETGIRIATTLGSFFLFVLLTLLYKSRKKKYSPEATPLPSLRLLPLEQTNGNLINLNQIHPYNHFPPRLPPRPLPAPSLLLTTPNSDSEDDQEANKPSFSRPKPNLGNNNRNLESPLLGRGGSRLQCIDIHVILPTPTISPSSSEHFRETNNSIQIALPPPSRDRRRSSSITSGGSSCATAFAPTGAFTSFFLDNLKYVDDTSSENIPTDVELDQGSIGSDSVFGFDHPPPLPPSSRRVSSASAYSGLTSGSGASGYIRLSCTQAQVHRRDSLASDLESVGDYAEPSEGGRRRSSSTQTTLSDLQHCLNVSYGGPRLSSQRSLAKSPSPLLVAPNVGGYYRKRPVDSSALSMRKAFSLQCDEDYVEDEAKQ